VVFSFVYITLIVAHRWREQACTAKALHELGNFYRFDFSQMPNAGGVLNDWQIIVFKVL
jgi:hypothetical protein